MNLYCGIYIYRFILWNHSINTAVYMAWFILRHLNCGYSYSPIAAA